MPELSESQDSGFFGEGHVHQVVETGWGCIYSPPPKDVFKVDGVVVDVVGEKVQPLQFFIQVKTRARFGKGDQFLAPVDEPTVRYWAESNVPTVLVCVEYNPTAEAYWRLIGPGDHAPIYMSRSRVFGPMSRDAVVSEVKRAIRRIQPATSTGRVLRVPLNGSLRSAAKEFYQRLRADPPVNPIYGPIQFTCKGWRHITRQRRSTRKIAMSLALLPCVREMLSTLTDPSYYRELPTQRRGSYLRSRSLLVFDADVQLVDRANAKLRVVVEREILLPVDWKERPSRDRRRQMVCRCYSISELPG